MSKLKQTAPARRGFVDALVGFALRQKLVVLLGALLLMGVGIMVAPFDWNLRGLPRSPVPVDAIPDIGENQQIVFTRWPGRSPQDVQDQITYPLTALLLGVPGVRTVRSSCSGPLYAGRREVQIPADRWASCSWRTPEGRGERPYADVWCEPG